MATNFKRLLASFSSDNDTKGKQFEKTVLLLLRRHPLYKKLFRQVWLWDVWPDRDGPDNGIDIVAETHEGELWAVQCKCTDPDKPLNKAEIDSFGLRSSTGEFSRRLVVSTSRVLGAGAKRALHPKRKTKKWVPVSTCLYDDLINAPVKWPKTYKELNRLKAARKRKPRKHQRKALADVTQGFLSSDRGQLIMACGTGKTLVGLWLAEYLKARRTIVFVPSLSLVKQTLAEYSHHAKQRFDPLVLCSDKTVTPHEGDAPQVLPSELGIPVTTDSGVFAKFMRKHTDTPRVVFCTYQSAGRVAEAYRTNSTLPYFDLLIADEAHHCTGASNLQKHAVVVTDAKRIKARKRLFMTATPKICTPYQKRRAKEENVKINSMDDEAVFGPVLHRFNFAQAIEKNLLSDYQVVVAAVTAASVKAIIDENDYLRLTEGTDAGARQLAEVCSVLYAMRKYRLSSVLTFHNRVKDARAFVELLQDVFSCLPKNRRPPGVVDADYVSGTVAAGKRAHRAEGLRQGEHKKSYVLANVRCFSEGVDIPALDAVAFMAPKGSSVEIVQAVGRALRLAPGKKVGTILLPAFVHDDADAEKALDDSVFSYIAQVVRAMAAHDSSMQVVLNELRISLGARPRYKVKLDKIVFDTVLVGRVLPTNFLDSIVVKTLQRVTDDWYEMFGRLKAFVKEKGRLPNEREEYQGVNLGGWCVVQRQMYRQNRLLTCRQKSLRSIHIWVWNILDADWDFMYDLLGPFVAKKNRRPKQLEYFRDEPLGAWFSAQRQNCENISMYRSQRLEEIIPKWKESVRDLNWEEAFVEFELVVRETGQMPSRRTNQGIWFGVQQTAKRGGYLSKIREERITAILPRGAWNQNDDAWEKRFTAYRTAEQSGELLQHSDPRQSWFRRQCTKYSRGELSNYRTEKMKILSSWENIGSRT